MMTRQELEYLLNNLELHLDETEITGDYTHREFLKGLYAKLYTQYYVEYAQYDLKNKNLVRDLTSEINHAII